MKCPSMENLRKDAGVRYLNHSKERSGWDNPLSEPQRAWIVPAKSEAVAAFAGAKRYRKRTPSRQRIFAQMIILRFNTSSKVIAGALTLVDSACE